MPRPFGPGAIVVLAALAAACSSTGSPSPAPPTTNACSSSLVAESTAAQAAPAVPKSRSEGDRKTRRGRVYEELWKHEQAVRRRTAPGRVLPQEVSPAAAPQDSGQIAIIRDAGDVVLPVNSFDLRSAAIAFARNGVGTFDVRRSTRTFSASVGDRVALGDDASAAVSLPFNVPFYSAQYNSLFINSDGNVTFVNDDHESTARNVARFLTGPPRIALLFDDLDPSAGGDIFRRIDSDAVTITWCNVPEFDTLTNRVNAQMRIGNDGNIDFIYGSTVTITSAVVGVSPGATGVFAPVDLSTASANTVSGGTGAVGERFSTQPELDFVAMAKTFYQTHADDFDQFVVFTNNRTVSRGTFAYEFTVANEVTGIGVDVFDSSKDFGSRGRLRSIVLMDQLSRFPDDPRQKFLGENNTVSVLGQECGHRWLAYLEFRDGTTNSSALLGRDEAHWSFFFDSDASNMEGNDISDLGNGQFRTVGAVSRYSALDQYAMGLRAPSEVPPMFLVTAVTSGGAAEAAPRIGIDIRGTRKDVRIEDIVAAMGARRPDSASAQKTFRQAFLYVVNQTAETSDELAKLERIRAAWETYFSESTDGRGTMNVRLR